MACETECLLGFLGHSRSDGYRVYKRRGLHRIAWEDANRACILPGFEVMHLCDVPGCINPKHLSLGTHKENMHDSIKKGRDGGRCKENKLKTHCEAGHPLETEHIYNRKDGRRECRVCKRVYNAERYKRISKRNEHVTT